MFLRTRKNYLKVHLENKCVMIAKKFMKNKNNDREDLSLPDAQTF